ncbi:MAG TPA: pilus assembly protein PilB, partial [Lentisphaeria bacterium]|nr:pilus assembly protein PilB [Lentisphaeria bacterium]
MDELGYVLGMDVRINVAQPDMIMASIEKYFPEDEASEGNLRSIIADMEKLAPDAVYDDDDEEDEEDLANATPIVRFVNVILAQGVKDRASDIHFEPFAEEFRIRYRIDGTLYEMQPPPIHLAIPVISRVKVLSGLDISESRKPQDGRIELRISGKRIDLRVSSLPTQYGESVVL